jgi:hypothetical protein
MKVQHFKYAARAFMVFAAMALGLAGAARAAEIKADGSLIELSGDIQTGDLSKLQRHISNSKTRGQTGLVLSLNSNGGSFEEGLNISEVVFTNRIATVVKKGNRCASACGLIFLGGWASGNDGESLPDRRLEPGAELGFHAPFSTIGEAKINVDDTMRALNDALARVNFMFGQLQVPDAIRSLLLKNTPDHALFDATTVEIVELLDITVVGIDKGPAVITQSMAMNACLNGFRLAKAELPSAKRAQDTAGFDAIIKKHKLIKPVAGTQDYALLPSSRLPNGDISVCRLDTAATCEGFYGSNALADPKVVEREAQLDDYVTCRTSNIGTSLVKPDVRLANLQSELENMAKAEPVFMVPAVAQPDATDPEDATEADPDDVAVAPPPPAQQPLAQPQPSQFTAFKRIICNTRTNESGEQLQFANLRQGPNGRTPLVRTINNSSTVDVIGEARNPDSGHLWNRVRFSGSEGFIDNELLSNGSCLVAIAPPRPVVVPKPAPAPSAGSVISVPARRAVVCNREGDSVNLRTAADPKNSRVLRKLFNHADVKIIGETNNPRSGQLYFKIDADGTIGFAFAEMITTQCDLGTGQAQAPAPETRRQVIDTGQICNPKSAVTNMRSGPNKDMFGIVSELRNGTPVEIFERVTNPVSGKPWFKVNAEGEDGFVDASSVTTGDCNPAQNVEAASTGSGEGSVICNGKSTFTNMRSGPNSKLFDTIMRVENQTGVRVLGSARNPDSGHLWLKIEVDGNVGFVDSDMVAESC